MMKINFIRSEKATKRTYKPLIPPKHHSKTLKKGRMKKMAFSEGSCPALTGRKKEAQRTGVRIKATSTEKDMAAIRVTENWR